MMHCSVFQLLEEAYNLVQHQVSEGLNALKEECRALTKDLEGTIRSDMDQIVTSKNFLTGKIRGWWNDPLLLPTNKLSTERFIHREDVLSLCIHGSHICGFHQPQIKMHKEGKKKKNVCNDQVQASLLFPKQYSMAIMSHLYCIQYNK